MRFVIFLDLKYSDILSHILVAHIMGNTSIPNLVEVCDGCDCRDLTVDIYAFRGVFHQNAV